MHYSSMFTGFRLIIKAITSEAKNIIEPMKQAVVKMLSVANPSRIPLNPPFGYKSYIPLSPD